MFLLYTPKTGDAIAASWVLQANLLYHLTIHKAHMYYQGQYNVAIVMKLTLFLDQETSGYTKENVRNVYQGMTLKNRQNG